MGNLPIPHFSMQRGVRLIGSRRWNWWKLADTTLSTVVFLVTASSVINVGKEREGIVDGTWPYRVPVFSKTTVGT